MAETAVHAARLLLALLNDILDFSKIEAGRLLLEAVPFEPGPLVQQCTESLAVPARAKGLAVTCALDPALPAQVVGDPTRLRQVLTNLLSNAIKFTERGEVAVSVRWDDGALRVAVRDTGPGIPPDRRAALFEPFVQLDGSHTRRYGGTGLGLAICRRLIDAMRGDIGVDSTPGQGPPSGFACRCPSSRRGRRCRRAVRPTGPGATARWGGLIAADGQQALERLANEDVDLVLMDCQMPGMDGCEATRRLRQRGWSGPVVALTANATETDRQTCLAAGMNDFVSKPYSASALEAVLRRWLTVA